jgi:hypothetical protein
MTVVVEPLVSKSISKIIEFFCGPRLAPREADILDYCQSLGEVYTGFVDGRFVCCWGLIPPSFLSTQAYLWMWAPEPIKHQFIFIRQSQLQIEKMLERYDSIIGHCYCNARSAQRWLKWLGAEFGEASDGKVSFVIRRAHG